MPTSPDDLMDTVRRDLADWHATPPRAPFAEMETAVEAQIQHLRASLLQERAGAAWEEQHPACPHCGQTMVPRKRSTRTVVLQGEEVVPVKRAYTVCPACGTGLFPPG